MHQGSSLREAANGRPRRIPGGEDDHGDIRYVPEECGPWGGPGIGIQDDPGRGPTEGHFLPDGQERVVYQDGLRADHDSVEPCPEAVGLEPSFGPRDGRSLPSHGGDPAVQGLGHLDGHES
jgi:hypothetical protein